ncbi:MAG: hypothetical protein PVS3B2_01870 [Candidatus Dormibacteraceae bacterium]
MAGQEFQVLVESGLLGHVEEIVVESHRNLYLAEEKEWSPPVAYRWLRYEDPMPVERLLEGTERLLRLGGTFDSEAVEKACAEASKQGYLS